MRGGKLHTQAVPGTAFGILFCHRCKVQWKISLWGKIYLLVRNIYYYYGVERIMIPLNITYGKQKIRTLLAVSFILITAACIPFVQAMMPVPPSNSAESSESAVTASGAGGLPDLIQNNAFLTILIILAIIAAVVYFGWWKTRQ